MTFVRSKTGIAVLLLLIAFGFLYFFTGAFGGTFIGITLRSNPDLENGLVAHYSFDGEYERGTFEFGTGGATTTDPGVGFDVGYGIDIDSSGYIYVTGSGDDSVCGGGGTDYCHYTFKVDPLNGNMVWATTTDPTSGDDEASSIVVADSGFIYIVGGCDGCGSKGGQAFYLYKIDPSTGDMIWATTTDPSTGSDTSVFNGSPSVTVDLAENIYVTGGCASSCGGAGGQAFYTYKVDPSNGDMIWATTTDPGSGTDYGKDIATDALGFVYVAGVCGGACGAATAHYVFKIDPDNGNMIWATSTKTGNSINDAEALVADELGYVYVTGSCDDCAIGGDAYYTYKVDASNGDMLWATTTLINNGEEGRGITLDKEGYIYVTGVCSTDCGGLGGWAHHTFKIDPLNGDMVWSKIIDPSSSNESARGIVADNNGNVFVTGSAGGNVCGGGGSDTCFYTYKLDASDGSMVDTTTAGAIAAVGATEVPGNIGQGVEFDGVDDYVTASDDGSLDDMTEFTYAAWIYPRSKGTCETGYSICGTIVGKGGEGAQGRWKLLGFNDTAQAGGNSNSFRGHAQDGFNFTTAANTVDYNTWQHVALSVSASNDIATIYKNGVALSSETFTGALGNDDLIDLAIGKNPASNLKDMFDGVIDDVRVYDRALGTSTLKRLYELGATTKVGKTLTSNPDLKEGLVGHWTFDSVEKKGVFGELIEDESTNSNYGTSFGVFKDREYQGIQLASPTTTLNFVADQWNGAYNDGEFDIVCSGGDSACAFATTSDYTATGFTITNGVACEDTATYSGYIMYSAESVHTRFSASPPHADNADNFICVEYKNGWYYDDNTLPTVSFTPVATDVLVAKIDTNANTISRAVYGPNIGPGVIGQAMEFDGVDDFVQLSNHVLTGSSGDTWSVAFWAMLNANDIDLMHIIGEYNDTDNRIALKPSTNELSVWLSDYSLAINVSSFPDQNNWHHYTVTRNGSAWEVYRDGVLNTTAIDSGAFLWDENGSGNRIGSLYYDSQTKVDGTLDDIRVYDRTLSANEVSRLYELGATTKIAKTIDTNDDLKNGLVGHWTFDGAEVFEQVTDHSGNGNTGYLDANMPTTTAVVPGVIGQALQFDGSDDMVSASDDPSLRLVDFSIGGWAKFNAISDYQYIVSKANGGENYYLYYDSWLSNTKLICGFGPDYDEAVEIFTPKIGVWYHFMCVFDDANNLTQVFIDGEPFDSTVSPSTPSTGASEVEIGDASFGTAKLNGELDDIRIYNRALSADEIQRLYQLGN